MGTQFKVGDLVDYAGNKGLKVTAVGSRRLLVDNCSIEFDLPIDGCRLVPAAPAAPPVPETPACGYWKHGNVMLHNPVWRKCDPTKDYWLGTGPACSVCWPGSFLVDNRFDGYRYCLSVLVPPGPSLDKDTIVEEGWRTKAIEWLEKQAGCGPVTDGILRPAIDLLRAEQEACK